jgi:hypothetical protein
MGLFAENFKILHNPLHGFFGDVSRPRGCINFQYIPDKGHLPAGYVINIIKRVQDDISKSQGLVV